MDKIRVKSNLGRRPDGGYPIALFERNDEHEGGEVFIADNKVHWVVLTSAVQLALSAKRLVQAGQGEAEGSEFDPVTTTDKVLEVLEDDTTADLEKRYNKAELVLLAAQQEVEINNADSKAVIAAKILGEIETTGDDDDTDDE